MAERIECTAENPAALVEGQRYLHPDAVAIGGCYDGCCDDFKCPHCGVEFRVEY